VSSRPDTPSSGPDVANRPAEPISSASTATATQPAAQPMHLHPALLAALRRRMAQVAGQHHPGEPFH
jgi:hypothetical protein